VESEAKAILKTAVYATTCGMGVDEVLNTLRDGQGLDPGIGTELAERFFQHPFTGNLLEAREEAQRRAWEAGYLVGAIANPISVNGKNLPHQAMARQAQRY
jgi:hypothetical protein